MESEYRNNTTQVVLWWALEALAVMAVVYGLVAGSTTVIVLGVALGLASVVLVRRPSTTRYRWPATTSSREQITGRLLSPRSAANRRPLVRTYEPNELPTFEDVAGMDALEAELRDTVGYVLASGPTATRRDWTGILLYGPQGAGKAFVARAIAGEYRAGFIRVLAHDLVPAYSGQSTRDIEAVFRYASSSAPCVLYIDELDAIAGRESLYPSHVARRALNDLLQMLSTSGQHGRVVVLAASTALDAIDPAVMGPGRFDRLVRVDLPDAETRTAILEFELGRQRVWDIAEVESLAERTEGWTPAALIALVRRAARHARREAAGEGERQRAGGWGSAGEGERQRVGGWGSAGEGERQRVGGWGPGRAGDGSMTMAHLLAALRSGDDGDVAEAWDDLVLSPEVLRHLQDLERTLADPSCGLGIVIAGYPGTGRSTIARMLAARTGRRRVTVSPDRVRASADEPVSGDEFARVLAEAVDQACARTPSLLLLDDLDILAATERSGTSPSPIVAEIDRALALRGVAVVATASNRDGLGADVQRHGRLERTIWVPRPDFSARVELLRRFLDGAPLRDISLAGLAAATEGLAPGDLKAMCDSALHAASRRTPRSPSGQRMPVVTADDFGRFLPPTPNEVA